MNDIETGTLSPVHNHDEGDLINVMSRPYIPSSPQDILDTDEGDLINVMSRPYIPSSPQDILDTIHKLIIDYNNIIVALRALGTLKKLNSPFHKKVLENELFVNNNETSFAWIHLNRQNDYSIAEIHSIFYEAHYKEHFVKKKIVPEILRNLFHCLKLIIPLIAHVSDSSILLPVITSLVAITCLATPIYLLSSYNKNYVFQKLNQSIRGFKDTKKLLYRYFKDHAHEWTEEKRNILNQKIHLSLINYRQRQVTDMTDFFSRLQQIIAEIEANKEPFIPIVSPSSITATLIDNDQILPCARLVLTNTTSNTIPNYLISETYIILQNYYQLKQHLDQTIRNRWVSELKSDELPSFFRTQGYPSVLHLWQNNHDEVTRILKSFEDVIRPTFIEYTGCVILQSLKALLWGVLFIAASLPLQRKSNLTLMIFDAVLVAERLYHYLNQPSQVIRRLTRIDRYYDLTKAIHRSQNKISSVMKKFMSARCLHKNIQTNAIDMFNQSIHALHQEIFPDTPKKPIDDIHTLRIKITDFWENRIFKHRNHNECAEPTINYTHV